MSSNPPLRSCLYMPGANARALEKARSLPADCVIFDLEDAVAPEAKAEARAQIAAAVGQGGYGERQLVVRTNAPDSVWGAEDLAMAMALPLNAILVPKVTCPADIALADAMLADAPRDMQLWAMIETPRAIVEIGTIAAMAQKTRLAGFIFGPNDYAKDMRAVATPGREAFLPAMAMMVAAARAWGIAAIDGVCNAIGDDARLLAEAEQARIMGFDGKSLIHPSQIAIANRVFSPDPDALAEAQAIIAAFDAPENAGKGVLKVDGKMAERLHYEQAQALVAQAAAIARLEQ